MLKQSILPLLCTVLLLSCKQQPVYEGGGVFVAEGKAVLFTTQSVFTVTSKKTRGGSTTRSGYTTAYLSAIDVATGQELQKVKLGDYKERVDYLGNLGGKAWFFSYNPAIGLHSRHAQTLQVETSAKDIIAKNPALSAGFTEGAYQQGVDSSGKYLFATTKDGYYYLIDPVTLAATKTGERSHRRYYISGSKRFGFNVAMNDSLEVRWKGGSGRRALVLEKQRFDKDSYAFYSRNNGKPSKNFYYKSLGEEVYDDISFIDPICLVNQDLPVGDDNRDPVLKNGNTLFVLHKSLIGNEFHWIVAALGISYTDKPQQLWQQPITATGKLDWSKKDIDYAGLVDGKLLLVFHNTALALDAQSGKVLWEQVLED
jgi:hypothetical protein